MAITISGQNNNDKILASDGVLDSISGFNVVGVLTATTFEVNGKATTNHISIGNNIHLGNAGIITATTLLGNVTGNINHTSNLLLQINGSEKFRVGNSGQFGIGGANYGTAGQVFTSGGSGSAPTWSTINSDKITEGNNEAEVIDDGSNGYFKVTTEGGERVRVGPAGQIGIAGANYGTSGQVLTSGGSGSTISWTTITGTTINSNADNRVITGSGSANTLNGESTLTYNGSGVLEISDSGSSYTLTGSSAKHEIGASASDNDLVIQNNKNTVNATSNIIFKGSGSGGESVKERLRIDSQGAISVQSLLTGNTALAYLKNSRTRASGNKYGIEFRDNINEANANIVIQQNSSGNNAAHMSFYINGGTGGNGLENGNHTLRLKQGGDVEIPTGNIEFRSLGSSTPQAAPASINMGGTHSNAAGNGTNLNAKLKVWSDGTDMMGFSVSSNQLDYILTSEAYDHVWYAENSGTTEMMRLRGDGNLTLTNGNKLNIDAATAAGQYGALLNIGWDGGTNIATKAIDIGGNWSGGENKRITFSHSTGANNLVGEINSIHYGGTPSRTNPHSGLRFGKLYHNGDSTTFTMSLDSTSATNADLNLQGAYRSNYHPAFSLAASTGQSDIGTTATKITYVVPSTIGRNQDNCYDTSNHRFVAPVDGVYTFYARHWFNTGQTGTIWLYFYRNGAQIKESRMSISSAPSQYNNIQLTSTIYLSATNYIEVYGASSSGTIFHVSNGSFHTEFSGFMVC